MIRWIKNILDIKNLLGMVRNVPPDPQYDPNNIVIRTALNKTWLYLKYTGTVSVGYTYGGQSGFTEIFGPEFSETFKTVDNDQGTDAIITGYITEITIRGTYKYEFLAIGNTVTHLKFYGGGSSADLHTLDFRNATNLASIGYSSNSIPNISRIYTLADNAAELAIEDFITNSNITDGELWINPNGTYASTIIAAAQTKGWSIYNL